MHDRPTLTDPNRLPTLVAMSGGVDSSVVALLLGDRSEDAIGVFMRNGVSGAGPAAEKSCCSASDSRDAARVAAKLGIPFYSVDYSVEFRKIIDEFVSEYRRGRTPNPCVLCNQDLKFGHLLQVADDLGAYGVATGHYAKVEDGKMFRARDEQKDQTYYLFGVDRAALPRMRFPLGDMTKAEVRERARAGGLSTAEKPESMEICFVTSGDYRDVVRNYASGDGGESTPGAFVDLDGKVIGEHVGIDGYTVGQRRGLPALGTPHFVKSIDAGTGTIVLATREQVTSTGAVAKRTNWLVDTPSTAGTDVQVKIRARSPATAARVTPAGDDPSTVHIEFADPTFAVTPGQAAVFYDGDLVLGGGWLD